MKNDELVHYINQNFQKDWLKIKNEELVLIYTGELKKNLDNKNIKLCLNTKKCVPLNIESNLIEFVFENKNDIKF